MMTRTELSPLKHERVCIVDDDDAMRHSLQFLMETAGFEVSTFPSARAFLGSDEVGCGCLLLDVKMPETSGPELQQVLRDRGIHIPIIFITGHADVATTARAMKNGAIDFIEKPFRDDEIIDRVHEALASCQALARKGLKRADIERRLATLSKRERQIMELVVAGMLNKQIAAALDLSQRTVENHRAHLMDKMEASGVAELIHMSVVADIS